MPEPQDVRVIRGLIDKQRPDVVLAHNWLVYSYLAVKRKSDPPVIWILHDYGAACHKKTVMYSPHGITLGAPCPGPRLDRCISCGTEQYGLMKSTAIAVGLRGSRGVLNSRVDLTVAVSTAVAEASQVAFERPIRVIPSFLADGLRELASKQPRPAFCPAGDYLLFVGSLDKHKGIDVLVEAFRALKAQISLVVIATAVPGDDRDYGDGVTLVVNAGHNQVMGAWAHCTLGVVPSLWEEPWGQVAAEAGTVGKAVVASRVGGLQEVVVDGETGILVPPNDARSLREAIDHLLASPQVREEMGMRAAEHVRPFTVSVVTDQIEQAISDVIEARSSPVDDSPLPTA